MSKTLRLAGVIQREIVRVGNAHRLARLINDANAVAHTGLTVGRRTLSRLARGGESARLTLKLLRALDVYLAPLGEGLQDRPVFDKKGILECLVETRNISFLLGSKPRPQARRNDLSRWDTRSMAELLREASRFDVHMDFEIEDVLWKTPMDAQPRDRIAQVPGQTAHMAGAHDTSTRLALCRVRGASRPSLPGESRT